MSRKRDQKNPGRQKINITSLPKHLQHINVNAAGIDIGSEQHFVAVPEGRSEIAVRQFGAFTADLEAIADWLAECGVTTVAMESTGVYWMPLFELLERRGFEVKLVDARHVKNVSGRKSDTLDCQWLQQLHIRFVERSLSTTGSDMRAARLSSAERNAGPGLGPAYPAYAEGTPANELVAA